MPRSCLNGRFLQSFRSGKEGFMKWSSGAWRGAFDGVASLKKWGRVLAPSGPPPEALIEEGSSRGAPHGAASVKKWGKNGRLIYIQLWHSFSSWDAANGGVTNGGLRGVWPPFLEIGQNRPFSPFFCIFRSFPEGAKSTWKIQKTEEKNLFPQISPDLLKPPSLKPPFPALQFWKVYCRILSLSASGVQKSSSDGPRNFTHHSCRWGVKVSAAIFASN